MYAEDVCVGQVVRYKKWEKLLERWETDEFGDLRIVDSAGRTLNYTSKNEVDYMCVVDLMVEDIDKASEGCYVLLTGVKQNDQVESFWAHCYKLDPVEQEGFSFDETGFLSMLGVKEG